MGWPYKGVLRLEMVCRNKVDVDADPAVLKAPLEQGGFTGTSGWQFSIGAIAIDIFNGAIGGNFVSARRRPPCGVVTNWSDDDFVVHCWR